MINRCIGRYKNGDVDSENGRTLCIFLGPISVCADEVVSKNEFEESINEVPSLEAILKNVKLQLELQKAEDLYEMFEDIITRKYNNIHNGYNTFENEDSIVQYGKTLTSGSGKLYYHLNNKELEFTDLYLSANQTKKYYNDLVRADYGNSIVELILSLINSSMSFGFYKQHVLINPLHDIINSGTGRANILSNIDNTDMGRKTMIVIDWGSSYPYMTYPNGARGLTSTTPLNF
ncbi:hypothetical protein [Microaceticoccus formicicus]|uniref:hypothetical protein n=1 Tax=Microaceticoccus formicicus TaxID=3118105 RepID=UPI003CD0204E|nr:hypothetical protein VZL98_11890 [Peptoniphilaceae bacterium AMB_02]